MYAELAVVDRLSFHQIASSNFIRNAMLKEGLKSHTSHNTVKHKVFQYYDEAKVIVIDHLQKKIEERTVALLCHLMNTLGRTEDTSLSMFTVRMVFAITWGWFESGTLKLQRQSSN